MVEQIKSYEQDTRATRQENERKKQEAFQEIRKKHHNE